MTTINNPRQASEDSLRSSTKLRILILDDSNERHEAFGRIYSDHEVVSVTRYFEFVERLSENWDLIHLDHDLGDFSTADTYVDGWGKTQEYNGKHAAMRICELVERKPLAVIVHSINSVGAIEMVKMLRSAGIDVKWEPFGDVR